MMNGVTLAPLTGLPASSHSIPAAAIHGLERPIYHTAPKAKLAAAAAITDRNPILLPPPI